MVRGKKEGVISHHHVEILNLKNVPKGLPDRDTIQFY